MTASRNSEKQLTGKNVLWIVIAFFAVIVASNAFMITKSVTSFRGEDTKKSYLQGLHYNDTLAQRAAQEASGWAAELDHSNTQVKLRITNGLRQPVSSLKLHGKLRHPTDTSKDIILEFTQRGDGRYIAPLPHSTLGHRILVTSAETNKGFNFETRNTLWLQ